MAQSQQKSTGILSPKVISKSQHNIYIHPGWYRFMDANEIPMKEEGDDRKDIFLPFSIDPHALNLIVLGKRPYINRRSKGLAFALASDIKEYYASKDNEFPIPISDSLRHLRLALYCSDLCVDDPEKLSINTLKLANNMFIDTSLQSYFEDGVTFINTDLFGDPTNNFVYNTLLNYMSSMAEPAPILILAKSNAALMLRQFCLSMDSSRDDSIFCDGVSDVSDPFDVKRLIKVINKLKEIYDNSSSLTKPNLFSLLPF